MKLTSKGKYALCAMLDLVINDVGKPIRLQEISTRQGISLHYLEQLFRRLRTGGVVKSVRGPGGGYVLAREADSIKIIEILQAVNESVTYQDQLKLDPNASTEAKKAAEYFGTKLDQEVLKLLQTDTLAALAK